ncbi:Aste57867_23204 [Aphanomyces stellatus]|uniref:Aste57867_23204 protein n=1 Tax=Aphanomyces stellatus TaxID=120398 RepID=A0A485LN67_9STRA|nr:hypothetical protein As57867_023133 [Aphanomyces stellatus]VFT99851.1 Aste57867_23204 [Aphanomyces stellatus]
MWRRGLCLAAVAATFLLTAHANQEIYRWDAVTQRHVAVFSFSNREHEVYASQDPRQRKWFLTITNAADAPVKAKAHVKVVERKHSYPIMASIISCVILLTTIIMIIKYTT